MKWMKRISLFFVYTVINLLAGCCLGFYLIHYFYPNNDGRDIKPDSNQPLQNVISTQQETLCVETRYIVEEIDINGNLASETTWKLPDKYIGMNREQFLEAMELYESFPPLSEKERGFVGLQVAAFSREQVIIKKNYQFIQPSNGFYIAAYNNRLRVYLADRQTVYIDTDILIEILSEELQKKILTMMYIETQEELYDFLETYSS